MTDAQCNVVRVTGRRRWNSPSRWYPAHQNRRNRETIHPSRRPTISAQDHSAGRAEKSTTTGQEKAKKRGGIKYIKGGYQVYWKKIYPYCILIYTDSE
jgi:hypothetical protein